jgi:hypothetical protein
MKYENMSNKEKIQQLKSLITHHKGCETKLMYPAVIKQIEKLQTPIQLELNL